MSRAQRETAEDPLLTIAEAVQYLGFSHDTLARRIKAHEIPYIHPLGDRRRKLFRKSDLDAHIERASQPRVGAA